MFAVTRGAGPSFPSVKRGSATHTWAQNKHWKIVPGLETLGYTGGKRNGEISLTKCYQWKSWALARKRTFFCTNKLKAHSDGIVVFPLVATKSLWKKNSKLLVLAKGKGKNQPFPCHNNTSPLHGHVYFQKQVYSVTWPWLFFSKRHNYITTAAQKGRNLSFIISPRSAGTEQLNKKWR